MNFEKIILDGGYVQVQQLKWSSRRDGIVTMDELTFFGQFTTEGWRKFWQSFGTETPGHAAPVTQQLSQSVKQLK